MGGARSAHAGVDCILQPVALNAALHRLDVPTIAGSEVAATFGLDRKARSGGRAWIGTGARSDLGRSQILAGNGVLRIWDLGLKGFVLARRGRRFFVRFFKGFEI